jgi:hypothetical protein
MKSHYFLYAKWQLNSWNDLRLFLFKQSKNWVLYSFNIVAVYIGEI